MKKIFNQLFVNNSALLILIFIFPVIKVSSVQNYLYVLLTLTFLEIIFKPISKLLFLPLNALTFNLLFWVPTALNLYLVTFINHDASFGLLHISQTTFFTLTIPTIHFGLLSTLIFSSLVLSLTQHLITWAAKSSS